MNKTRYYIRILLLVLLLVGGGIANEVWAVKVTYHIITLPFGYDQKHDCYITTGDQEYCIEALKVEVNCEDGDLIGLPTLYKSPLLTDDAYIYYKDITKSALTKIFKNNDSQFYTYPAVTDIPVGATNITGKTVGEAVGEAAATDVYVYYTWDDAHPELKTDFGKKLNLKGGKKYNIEFKSPSNSSTSQSWFFATNMDQGRGNRAQAIPVGDVMDYLDLSTKGPHEIKNANISRKNFDFMWKLVNDDPYNIILETAYEGDFIYVEECYSKKVDEARVYGILQNGKPSNYWMTNEWYYVWKVKNSSNSENIIPKNPVDPSLSPVSPDTKTGSPEEKPGWFRNKDKDAPNNIYPDNNYGVKGNGVSSGLYFSFSLIKRSTSEGDYTMVASWVDVDGKDWVPNGSKQYLHLGHNTTQGVNKGYPGPTFSTFDNADKIIFHEIKDYTFKLKTSFYDVGKLPTEGDNPNHILTVDIPWSDYAKELAPHEYVPKALLRKYVNFIGSYKEVGLLNPLTSFAKAQEENEGFIWLNYESTFPYDVLPYNGSYEDATWYTLRLNGNVETKYVAYYDKDHSNQFSTGLGSNSDLHQGENYPKSQFAFMGDPFEMRLINRLASEDAGSNRFVGCTTDAAAPSLFTAVEATGYHNRWEIVPDNVTGSMQLREFGTYDNSKYIGWDYSAVGSERPMIYANTASYIRVVEIAKKNYVYHIMRSDGSIAVKASIDWPYGVALKLSTIPEIIRSPFLELSGVTLTYYWTENDAKNETNPKTSGSYEYNTENDIYVRYDMGTALDNTPGSYIKGETTFNVRLNGQYIYYDNGTIKSETTMGTSSTDPNTLIWFLDGSDPYAMIIKNKVSSSSTGLYVTVPNGWADGSMNWDSSAANATKFIIKGTENTESSAIYEVMAATGDIVDASDTYYNIGRPSGNNTTVKVYGDGTYAHGYEQLRFQLTKVGAVNVTYHLIDKQGKDLLQVVARQEPNTPPVFPSDYRSPLVANYYYHAYGQFTVTNDVYHLNVGQSEAQMHDVGLGAEHVYVTYDANNKVDMHHTTMYLLKFEKGTDFNAEDGADGLEKEKVTPVYPYCNGDCNLNIYGENQFEVQQNGAASTRTRWAWYVESGENDPYHVKIFSRQTETYDGVDRNAYFATYIPDGQEKPEVVTNVVWPNITGTQATDYMVLGNVGQYQLVTSYPITVSYDENKNGTIDPEETTTDRYVLNSFEQYWKTYDLIRRKVLGQDKSHYPDDPNDPMIVPETPFVLTGTEAEGKNNRTYLEDVMGWHTYHKMAYAKRWNGYNKDGAAKKGWEKIEHWFETVKMGEGYFNFVPFTVDAALILLDQHGWEIMRKPLPYSDEDPKKLEKEAVLRTYDSPMVKEYIFWSSAKKRSGFHQYYLMDKRIGGDFTSTSLGDLPPWGSENILDAKGNHNDHYVTYIVKDEYAQSYNPSTKKGDEFLIRQGDKLAKNDGTATIATVNVPATGGVSQHIIGNITELKIDGAKEDELWYVKPNAEIDKEMGYIDASGDTKSNHDWGTTNPNAYDDDSPFATARVADLVTNTAAYKALSSDDKKAMTTKYGLFTFSNGFDPYNIQISSQSASSEKFFTLNMKESHVEEGIMQGTYTALPPTVTLAEAYTPAESNGTGYDNNKWYMTNQTLMAVQDMDGNMQLMPRFDHNLRMRDFRTLVTPTTDSGDEDKLKQTYTELYRPYVYNYRIIDNSGHESMRYQSGGELTPQTPDHFKSPLAKDFKYYKAATYDSGTKVYTINESTDAVTSADEITETSSMAGANMYDTGSNSNIIYIRYAYDEETDVQHVLQGKWLTMKIGGNVKKYDSGNGINTEEIPNPLPAKPSGWDEWHWKFLRTPHTDPDPYAVQILNCDQGNNPADKPMTANAYDVTYNPDNTEAKIYAYNTDDNTKYQYFVLLSHTDGSGNSDGYALAVARTEINNAYLFVNGVPTLANIATESGFTNTSCTFDADTRVNSKVEFSEDIEHKYLYKVYTNYDPGNPSVGVVDKYGQEAVSAYQDHSVVEDNEFVPTLPDVIKTPLLNLTDFIYYENEDDMGNPDLELKNLYGLYETADSHESVVYVRYKAYDPTTTEYKVPNHKDTKDDHVARGSDSNDAPIRLNGELPYNIIWYNDNMMKGNGTGNTVQGKYNQDLNSGSDYVWKLVGNDPYAIKVKNGENYIDSNAKLSATAQTFMLLPKDGYDYGVLATTGNSEHMLTITDDNNNTPEDVDDASIITSGNPQQFIIFALGAENVIYHLVISNIKNADGSNKWYETIPYRKGDRATDDTYKWNEMEKGYSDVYDNTEDVFSITGTSMRDLKTQKNGVDGDKYQLGGTMDGKTYCIAVGPISLGDNLSVPEEFYRPNVVYDFFIDDIGDETLNNKFKGMKIESKQMGTDENLLNKTVHINIVYSFNGNLDSNNGDNFVLSRDENKWYTLETMDDDSPWLSQYTNAWGFELKEGRGTHYTNDFLWTPIGDPYGFQLFNRYMEVNSGNDNLGEPGKVITTEDIEDEEQIIMGQCNDFVGSEPSDVYCVIPGKSGKSISLATLRDHSIYELLKSTTTGYFRFHPVANTKDQTQVYLKTVKHKDGEGNVTKVEAQLGTTATEFTFGLSKELMKPYFDRAGYVGGLKKDVYDDADNKDVVDEMKKSDETMNAALLMKAQGLVYDLDNILPFETGYYRLHSPLGISGVTPSRYASGYTHHVELGTFEGHVIPMHFYEKNSDEVRTFTDLKEGFTYSHATRGDLPISPVEKDPASIFFFKKKDGKEGTRENFTTISTEGLYVKGTVAKGIVETDDEPGKNTDFASKTGYPRAAAVMTAAAGEAQELFVMDIGGGILLIHDNETANGRTKLKYLSFDYEYDLEGSPTIYDLKMTHNTHTDHAKWCMQPVQKSATKGVNEMGLKLDLHRGGDGYYYSTFYAPFAVLLTGANDVAFVSKETDKWDGEIMHLKKVGKLNTGTYDGNDKFVPACTPVIIRSTATSTTLALPEDKPIASALTCMFTGEYLEQLLTPENDGTNDVYSFGLPVDGTSKVDGYGVSGEYNGVISAVLPQTSDRGVGFYINCNPNREAGGARGEWIRNNRYVYNNRVYYRASSGGSARQGDFEDMPDFIPVVFDDEDDDDEELQPDGSKQAVAGDNRVYDLQGRCVATEEMVKDGTWRRNLTHGIYILNGKKVYVK